MRLRLKIYTRNTAVLKIHSHDIQQHIGPKAPLRLRNTRRRQMNDVKWNPSRLVSFAEIHKTIGTPSEPRKDGTPVRITSRDEHYVEPYSDELDFEFVTHIKKRAVFLFRWI